MSVSFQDAEATQPRTANEPPTGPIPLVLAAGARFAAILQAELGICQAPDPTAHLNESMRDMRWRNLLLASPTFRRAHVEELSVPGRLVVLHVCIFPHLDDPAPVFGFDLVGGPTRITGAFIDFSPVLTDRLSLQLRNVAGQASVQALGERRGLPSWGEIFSEDLVAIRPQSLPDVVRAAELGEAALAFYLRGLAPGTAVAERSRIAAGQNRYVAAMRQNIHTSRMLGQLIGSAPARRFIDEVLFPQVDLMTPIILK